MEPDALLQIEVAYALASEQVVVTLCAPFGVTVAQAVDLSQLAGRFDELRSGAVAVGIYGKIVSTDTLLKDGDRVEIYRPLVADAKQARRRRASALRQ